MARRRLLGFIRNNREMICRETFLSGLAE